MGKPSNVMVASGVKTFKPNIQFAKLCTTYNRDWRKGAMALDTFLYMYTTVSLQCVKIFAFFYQRNQILFPASVSFHPFLVYL